MSAPDLVARVAESRAAQGLPPVVEDPAALSKCGRLLRPLAASRKKRAGSEARPTSPAVATTYTTTNNVSQPAADLTTSPSCLPG